MLNGEDVNFFGDVLGPVNDRPLAEPFYFTRTTFMIVLDGITGQEGILGQRLEDAQQAFALAFGKGGEGVQHRVINGVAIVGHRYFPSAESLSWRRSRSSRE